MDRNDFHFFFPFRVRYAETDAQGIVFYGNYLIYFDTAIYEYFRSLPFDFMEHVRHTGSDFHTVHVSVNFHSPARFDNRIDVGVRTCRIGKSSLTFDVAVFGPDTTDPLVRGQLVWVNTDQAACRAAPLPQDLVQRIRDREKTL
jgi:acyl-CoA thioester hydrolase